MATETEFCADDSLRDHILVAVAKSVESEAQELHVTVSPRAMTAMGDLVLKYLEQMARDLETFAQHAGRKSVNMDDVLLTVRRNPSIAANLTSVLQELATTSKKNQADKLKKKQDVEEAPLEKPKRRKKDPDDVQPGNVKLKKKQDDVQVGKLRKGLEFDEGEELRKKFMTGSRP
ncbi:centromere protein S [Marchantia polymorpha subsp. ruderalis]|uniref:Centromere protein S n=1 Tax=Marchantia polymorpha TaxID=3197 RepID=A0A2R6WCP3_MARPO|nr:hypothetical protein MARPO_0109s0028 [Marchantia polymorpha]BBN02639.1 hypothetical protein Mp_2g16870 [Marchantia polymorpha subsp. ruderalis]|eukprot:PTQ31597.1 hypothetical protein MARPO_0109s0028 [Marchantia polymorpha]